MNSGKKNNPYRAFLCGMILADFFIDQHKLSGYILATNNQLSLSEV